MNKNIPRRRIFLSCFACSPGWGSEPGVGWRWLEELSKSYDVVLVTHAYFRERIDTELASHPMEGLLGVHYFAPNAFGISPDIQINSRLYYIWWQWCLGGYVKGLLKSQSFDLIHHLTWGTFRFPTFLGRKGVPLVMGPLGGGDVAPMRLYAGLPFVTQAREWVRDVSLRFAKFDPLAMWGPMAASLVLCKTEDTLRALPASIQARAVIAPEIGAPVVDLSSRQAKSATSSPFRLLFAGTLSGVKGIVLAIGAVHSLTKAGYDVTLDIAGKGPLRDFLLGEIDKLGLSKQVCLLGMLPREELMALYGQADLFVFPSLHDSSGNVVLESLSRGLPVICLDLGGPKYYVTPQCGVIVSTLNRTSKQVEQALAESIADLIDQPNKLREMSDGAVQQAHIQTWAARVNNAYALIEQRLGWQTKSNTTD